MKFSLSLSLSPSLSTPTLCLKILPFLPRSIPLDLICDIITVTWSAPLNGANRRRWLELREEITKSASLHVDGAMERLWVRNQTAKRKPEDESAQKFYQARFKQTESS